jgi:predicted enzyme related to lactoylglutathione lyase
LTNPIVHIDIPLTNTEHGTDFYRTVFGWEINNQMPSYPMFQAEGGPGGGFVQKGTGPQQIPSPTIFLGSTNIDASLAAIGANGGSTIVARTEIEGGHGAFAVFSDPSGNTLALYQAPAQQ